MQCVGLAVSRLAAGQLWNAERVCGTLPQLCVAVVRSSSW